MKKILLYVLPLPLMLLTSCKDANKENVAMQEENTEAKAMLQGVWLDADNEEVTMRVSGDSIVYADSTLAPVHFAIVNDSLVLKGYSEVTRYAILKQTEHVFQFENLQGDVVSLVKADENSVENEVAFVAPKPQSAQQSIIEKRDSVVSGGDHSYRVYTQINQSRSRVVSTSYNDDGVKTETVFYDNVINVCVYEGARRVYGHDFKKKEFQNYVPDDYLKQSRLSDVVIDKVSDDGVEMLAFLGVPDAMTSYVVRLIISHDGKLTMKKE